MVKKEQIRSMQPGHRLEVPCSGAADLDSTYQTAYQTRRELGLSSAEMAISRIATREMIVIEYLKK